jgi:hypothetical protein
MGFNIQELGSLAGGAAEGYRKGVDTRISANEENRKQTAENERRASYEMMEQLKGIMSEFPGLLDPSQAAQAGYIPPADPRTGTAPEALPSAGGGMPGSPAATPPPQEGTMTFAMNPPGEPPAGGPTQGAGTGMFGDDLPPTQGQGALPAGGGKEATPPGGEMALSEMQVPGDADTAGPRAKLQDWKQRAMAAAAKVGGVQAMQQVEDYYQMATQGQMYQYASEAARAAADGSAGTAAKLLNTAMEIAPVDPEIEFFAMNGELYGQRGDSDPVKYSDMDIAGLTKQYLMDSKNFLEWQENLREDRKTDISQQNADTAKQNADTLFKQYKLDEKYAERETQTREAQALASLMQAKAANQRAMKALEAGLGAGWDPSEMIRLMGDAEDWSIDAMEFLTDDVKTYMEENPNEFNHLVDDVQYTMLNNPAGSVSRGTAARISQYIRMPGGFDFNELPTGEKFSVVKGNQSGRLYAVVNGRRVLLTPELSDMVMRNPDIKVGEGGQAAPTEPSAGVLPGTQ